MYPQPPLFIRVTRMGSSIMEKEDPIIYLTVKTINYITKDEYGHTKIIMHRGAIKVEEEAVDVINTCMGIKKC